MSVANRYTVVSRIVYTIKIFVKSTYKERFNMVVKITLRITYFKNFTGKWLVFTKL